MTRTINHWFRRSQLRPILVSLFSFLLGLLSRFLFTDDPPDIRWLPVVIVLILLVVGLYIAEMWQPRKTIVIPGSPQTLDTPEDHKLYARAGLVALVSKYRSFAKPPPSPEIIAAALANCDYRQLDLENSNLGTIIHAVVAHKSRLRHCWLIGSANTPTRDPARKDEELGSCAFIPLLQKYLHEQKGVQCTFWSGSPYAVSLRDDTQVYLKTMDLVKKAFEEARKLKIDPRDMVVDFTGGVRGMSAGAILAGLGSTHALEFLGTHYNEKGEPQLETNFLIIVPFKVETFLE